jgi:diketogulonate reductase-like aldo/keto reductase
MSSSSLNRHSFICKSDAVRTKQADLDWAHRADVVALGEFDTLIAIADEIGSNPGQIAIALVSVKGVLPVIGPHTRAQLDDNLASASLQLSDDNIRRLDEITAVPLGYPHELNAAAEQRAVMTGNRWDQIDFPTRTVA